MSVHEFVNWKLFSLVHPFPADIADIHGAQALALHANINRSATTPPYQVRDFIILRHDAVDRPPTPIKTEAERMRDALMGME
jgi:hypothetical protein